MAGDVHKLVARLWVVAISLDALLLGGINQLGVGHKLLLVLPEEDDREGDEDASHEEFSDSIRIIILLWLATRGADSSASHGSQQIRGRVLGSRLHKGDFEVSIALCHVRRDSFHR